MGVKHQSSFPLWELYMCLKKILCVVVCAVKLPLEIFACINGSLEGTFYIRQSVIFLWKAARSQLNAGVLKNALCEETHWKHDMSFSHQITERKKFKKSHFSKKKKKEKNIFCSKIAGSVFATFADSGFGTVAGSALGPAQLGLRTGRVNAVRSCSSCHTVKLAWKPLSVLFPAQDGSEQHPPAVLHIHTLKHIHT